MASEIPQVKPFHFFKIILNQSLHEGKLMIPRKFVEKYGEGLPKTISLKPPNGKEWKLDLIKSDGKIWFGKGWKEFADYHSLAHGHLLVFRYEKTCHFKIHIFDMSALEINYPFRGVEAKRVYNSKGNIAPTNEDCRAAQKRKAISSSEFLQQFEIGSSSRSSVKVEKLKKVEAMHHANRK